MNRLGETEILSVIGKVESLDLVELGDPLGDFGPTLQAEVLVYIDKMPDRILGLQLRDDDKLPSHEAMYDLLRTAATNREIVGIMYESASGRRTGVIKSVKIWFS